MGPRNLDRMTRIYGPATWDVYAKLDVSLDPRGPDTLHEMAAELLRPGDVVLDAGCRDADHLVRLVGANDVTGVGVEPVAIHVDRARAAVSAAGLDDRITIHQGVMHDLPYDDGHFEFVWCRDVIPQVDDLDGALREVRRVMKPDARMLVYTTFASDRFTDADLEMVQRHLGYLDGSLDRRRAESVFASAGFVVESCEDIGTEWREHAEERTQPTSKSLLRLSRLRRQRDDIVAVHGQDIYDHIEANLHWETFMLLGKLEPVIYVLRS